jgi:hypothetical protein
VIALTGVAGTLRGRVAERVSAATRGPLRLSGHLRAHPEDRAQPR